MKEKLNIGCAANPGESLKNKTGNWRVFKPKVKKEICISCGLCSIFCPDLAIEIKNKRLRINYDYCKGCGICSKECPRQAIYMEKEE